MNITKKVKVINIDHERRTEVEDEVVAEYSLSIFVNDVFLATLLCSRCSLKELTIGHLFTNRIISRIEEISGIVLEEKEYRADINVYMDEKLYVQRKQQIDRKIITSSSGKQYSYYEDIIQDVKKETFYTEKIFPAKEIMEKMKGFIKESKVFLETGGVHGCKMVASNGKEVLMEDIGRHNAFDKIIGYGLINEWVFSDSYVITSGRVPGDMVIKSVVSNIPVLVSKSAPTDISVKMAQKLGLTLVGFVRGERMNIYSMPERIQ